MSSVKLSKKRERSFLQHRKNTEAGTWVCAESLFVSFPTVDGFRQLAMLFSVMLEELCPDPLQLPRTFEC